MSLLRRRSLILLAWNSWELTRRALDTLRTCDLADCEVIVVDNGSSDATPAALSAYADWVRVLRLPRNLGYVRGNNAGIAAAHPDADIVLLNNDLEFTQVDWLRRLGACAAAADTIGIVGCRLVDGEGLLMHAGSLVLPDTCIGVQIASGRQERDLGQYAAGPRLVQGVVFAAVYIKREVISAIGMLHEDYDTYFEDSDYCLRAAAAGFSSVLCGEVTLVHRQHGSTGGDAVRRQALFDQGQAVFARHWREALRQRYRHTVLWQSALEFPPSVAAWSRPLLRALDRAGIDVRYESLYRRALPAAIAESGDSQDHVLNTLRTRAIPVRPPIGIACGDPLLFDAVRGDWRIGCAGFETPPQDDVLRAWQLMDELWVPSAWHEQALRRAGIAQPVQVMAPGIDIDYFHPQLRRVADPHREFVFLCVAEWDAVDQPWRLLEWFSRNFRRAEAVRLLCWITAPGVDLMGEIARLPLDPHGGRISYFAPRGLPENQDGVVYRSVDALVSVSTSTQRIDPLLRAMAVGTPVVAPRRGAAMELMDFADSYPLLADDAGALELQLVARMREVLADREMAASRGLAAAARVRETRSWDRVAGRITRRLDEIAENPRPAQRPPAPRNSAQARVIVLGMHRSGTSCVAGLLQLMGLHGAEPTQWLHAAADNPRGHFERADLHHALLSALRERGGDWSIPLGWDEAALPASRARLRDAFLPILHDLSQASMRWFIKEPRLCVLLPEILDQIDTPRICVHVVRSPGAVVASIVARDGLTVPHALALWEHYNLAAFAASVAEPRILVVYEDLVAQPLATTQRLHADLIAAGACGLRMPDAAEVGAWVAAEMDHGWRGAALPIRAAQASLWEAIRRGAIPAQGATCDAEPHNRALLMQLAEEHAETLRRERKPST